MFRLWLRQWYLPMMLLLAVAMAFLCVDRYQDRWLVQQQYAYRWLHAVVASMAQRMETVRQDADFLRQKTSVLDAIPELSAGWQNIPEKQMSDTLKTLRDTDLPPLQIRKPWISLEGVRDWANARGYADVLLLDADGQVLFSAEGDPALASNVNTGKVRHTVLNTAFREARRGQLFFSDVQPYPSPDGGAITSLFFSVMLEDARNNPIGVLALRMNPDELLAGFHPAARMLPGLRLYGADGSIHLEYEPEGTSLLWPETALVVSRAFEEGRGVMQMGGHFGQQVHFQKLDFMNKQWILAVQQPFIQSWDTMLWPYLVAWLVLAGVFIWWLWRLSLPWNELLIKVEALPHLTAIPELPFQYLSDVRGRFARVFLRLKELALEGRGVTGNLHGLAERLARVEREEQELVSNLHALTQDLHALHDQVDATDDEAIDTSAPASATAVEEGTSPPKPDAPLPQQQEAPPTHLVEQSAPQSNVESKPSFSVSASASGAVANPITTPAAMSKPSQQEEAATVRFADWLDATLLEQLKGQCKDLRSHLQQLHRSLLKVAKRQRGMAELQPEKLESLAGQLNQRWKDLFQQYSTPPEPDTTAWQHLVQDATTLSDAIRKSEQMVRQARLLAINAALEAGHSSENAGFFNVANEMKDLTAEATDMLKSLRESSHSLQEKVEAALASLRQPAIVPVTQSMEGLCHYTQDRLMELALPPSAESEEEASAWLKLTVQTADIAMQLQTLERRLKAIDVPKETHIPSKANAE